MSKEFGKGGGHGTRPCLDDLPAYQQSSFYREFLSAGQGRHLLDEGVGDGVGDGVGGAAAPVGEGGVTMTSLSRSSSVGSDGGEGGSSTSPRGSLIRVPASRPANRRRSSRRSAGNSTAQDAAAAAAALTREPSLYGNLAVEKLAPSEAASGKNLPFTMEDDDNVRTHSWMADALQQSGAAFELLTNPSADILHDSAAGGSAAAAADQAGHGFGDDEIREQYSIMAQHEAYARVKANLGYDPDDALRQKKKMNDADGPSANKKRDPLPPPPKPRDKPPNMQPKISEPPIPPPPSSSASSSFTNNNRPRFRYVERRTHDLCPGVPVATSDQMDILATSSGWWIAGGDAVAAMHVQQDEHVVRCLGCRMGLKVKKAATLVNCPDCMTVSPASSTRR